MKQKLVASSLIAALVFGVPLQLARAAVYNNGTATATFTVTIILNANCSITANPLNFGTNGVLGTAINQQSTVAVTCTNTTPYNVGLDAGTVTGSTVGTRLMAGTATGNTATTVAFNLYQDAGHGVPWGNTQGTNTVSGTGSGSAQSIVVYGQVPAQATPRPDTYQTTVTATVYF
ncbi:spore coat U domain-containing protein [Paraburkholderia sp. BCC1886]|uniref:Csu type fimbrial protein n=1 Tax=Paraburkholderia sp. BCC1886 TaxID=2562670 RepID=UPI0011821FC6|nr:spore coat U domain-containing protein [Paraburkholderia sp. BCC1886]